MAIKVASWNIEGRLSRFADEEERGSPEHIIEGIRQLDSDIVFLPEASDGDEIEAEMNDKLQQLGYITYTVDYEDGDKDRKWAAESSPNMKLLSRLAVTSFRQLRLGDIRNALVADVSDPESDAQLEIFGIHLDDRCEEYRLRQAKDLLGYLKEPTMPTVVMGDFNAMYGGGNRARCLRNWLTRRMFTTLPLSRTKDVLERLSDMASGETLAMLESDSVFKGADPRRRATTTPKMRFQEWMPSIRIVQIDHMLVTPDLMVTDFKVHRDGGSDHRAISATLEST